MTKKTKKNTKLLAVSAIGLTSFYLYFNRNPYREIQDGTVSPSDGTIESIVNNRIDIFIGITDVHFQRAPISGTITNIQDFPNENKNIITINNITVERRGGMIARSVITNVNIGDYVEKGQIIGRILLGSRCAIYPIYNPTVKVGDHVLAGQTIEL